MITPEQLRGREAALARRPITVYTRHPDHGLTVAEGVFGHLTETGLVYATGAHQRLCRAALDQLVGVEVPEEADAVALADLAPGRVLAAEGPMPGAVVARVEVLTPQVSDPLITALLRTPQGSPVTLTGPGSTRVILAAEEDTDQ
jgi:hypothetical protein